VSRPAGSVIAGYRIERELGSGGMGAVYLADNPTLPRKDALKVLSPELSRDPDFRARFMREADVAAALDHANIVAVYNRGQTEANDLWIAMQFVDGTDADAALRAGTMAPDRAVHIITEVAAALDHAHAHHVVHRDVKPANFLLSGPIGPKERVLLGDFGIARALDDVGLTVTGSVMATVAYAAPEVLSGLAFDGRADIYSLGCTLYRLLTGKTPFPATNGMAAVMMAHLNAPPPRVTDVVPSLPPALDVVIATAMAKNPAARFQTAAALAYAAFNALHDPAAPTLPALQPVPSGEVSSYPGPGPWWQQSGARTMLAPPGTQAQMPAAPSGFAPPPGKRRRGVLIGALAAVVVVAAGTAVAVWPEGGSGSGGPDASPEPTGSSTPAAQGAPATDVPASALRAILLTDTQIAELSGSAGLTLVSDDANLLDDAGTLSNAGCLSAWSPAQQPEYADSRVTGAAVQVLRALSAEPWQDGVIQAVVALSSQTEVGAFMRQQQRRWAACAGSGPVIVTTSGGPTQTWTFTPPSNAAGVVALTATVAGGGSCQRGVTARGNVVIDIRQCRSQGDNDVAALIKATSDRVPRQ
jgi:serine/threonine protein kinase